MSNPYRINEDLENAIVDFLKAICSKYTIQWDKQDSQGSQKGIKPPLPYLSLNIISGPTQTGKASETYKDEDTYTYKQTFVFTLSIQSFAQQGHLQALQDIQFSENLPSKMSILQKVGLAIWLMGDPIDISALQNTGHEMRGSLDMDFAYAIEIDDQVGEVQTVDIDGTLTTAADNEYDININKTIVP